MIACIVTYWWRRERERGWRTVYGATRGKTIIINIYLLLLLKFVVFNECCLSWRLWWTRLLHRTAWTLYWPFMPRCLLLITPFTSIKRREGGEEERHPHPGSPRPMFTVSTIKIKYFFILATISLTLCNIIFQQLDDSLLRHINVSILYFVDKNNLTNIFYYLSDDYCYSLF